LSFLILLVGQTRGVEIKYHSVALMVGVGLK